MKTFKILPIQDWIQNENRVAWCLLIRPNIRRLQTVSKEISRDSTPFGACTMTIREFVRLMHIAQMNIGEHTLKAMQHPEKKSFKILEERSRKRWEELHTIWVKQDPSNMDSDLRNLSSIDMEILAAHQPAVLELTVA